MGSKTGNPGDVIGCDLAPDLQLNLNVRGMPPSATLAINDRSDQLARQGTTVGAICRHIVCSPVFHAYFSNIKQKYGFSAILGCEISTGCCPTEIFFERSLKRFLRINFAYPFFQEV